MKLLFETEDSWPLLAIRVALGGVMLPHGAQKLLGCFGGHGFGATMHSMTQEGGLPWIIALLVIVSESFGSLGLIVGLLSRIAALGIASVMIGAIATVHGTHGFFTNWGGQNAGEGFEYHLLAIGMCLAVIIGGSGKLSLDRLIARRTRSGW